MLVIFRIFGYGRELFCTFEFIQTLYAQNDKEKVVNFYNLVFPGEAKMGLGFISFRAPSLHKNRTIIITPNSMFFARPNGAPTSRLTVGEKYIQAVQ